MKFTIRDIALFVAVVAIGLALVIHMNLVRAEIDRFKSHSEHKIAKATFDAKLDVALENFRRIGVTILENDSEWSTTDRSGTFNYEYVWSKQPETLVSAGKFIDAIRPAIESYSNTSQFMWQSRTEPELKNYSYFENANEGRIRIVVSYNFSFPE